MKQQLCYLEKDKHEFQNKSMINENKLNEFVNKNKFMDNQNVTLKNDFD